MLTLSAGTGMQILHWVYMSLDRTSVMHGIEKQLAPERSGNNEQKGSPYFVLFFFFFFLQDENLTLPSCWKQSKHYQTESQQQGEVNDLLDILQSFSKKAEGFGWGSQALLQKATTPQQYWCWYSCCEGLSFRGEEELEAVRFGKY